MTFHAAKFLSRTLPSLPSNNLTGQSLTDATKQNAGKLCRDAPGYHVKSTIGADCGNVLACTSRGDGVYAAAIARVSAQVAFRSSR